MKNATPDKYNYEDIKQYTVELNEVTARMDDQRFILQNGIVVTTKSLVVDFINFLNFFSHNQRSMKTTISALEDSNKRLSEDYYFLKEKNDELMADNKIMKMNNEDNEKKLEEYRNQLEKIQKELQELKASSRSISQKRTIQK
jgi:chromosome segregation ATPase